MEIFKDIVDYEGLYQISNLGRVKSLKFNKEKLLKPVKRNGYHRFIFYKDYSKTFSLHRLLMLTFKPEEYFEGAVINHIDGDKLNNNLDNLEWCTSKENSKHACGLGLINSKGKNNKSAKLTQNEVIQIRSKYKNKHFNQRELSKNFNVTILTINRIINNKTWVHT